jgi:glucose uptake protein GlcU
MIVKAFALSLGPMVLVLPFGELFYIVTRWIENNSHMTMHDFKRLATQFAAWAAGCSLCVGAFVGLNAPLVSATELHTRLTSDNAILIVATQIKIIACIIFLNTLADIKKYNVTHIIAISTGSPLIWTYTSSFITSLQNDSPLHVQGRVLALILMVTGFTLFSVFPGRRLKMPDTNEPHMFICMQLTVSVFTLLDAYVITRDFEEFGTVRYSLFFSGLALSMSALTF